MIETKEFIVVHIPKCGGMTLRKHLCGAEIHAKHDGVYALTPEERRKKIYALTRPAREWYQSYFQYCVEQNNPWIAEFELPYRLDAETFRLFLRKATVDPPPRQKLVIPAMRVPFDSFLYMQATGHGFWSFWHEFLCTDDPAAIQIAPDVTFIPMGDPRFFPDYRENVSTQVPIEWDEEMMQWLAVDVKVAEIVARQTL